MRASGFREGQWAQRRHEDSRLTALGPANLGCQADWREREHHLEGKVALVTGASGGIGLATARAFADAGASVVVADREPTISKAAEDLRIAGHEVVGVVCDVTDRAQVTAMVDLAVSSYGRLDAAFNNAGINGESADTLETSDEEFERLVSVNLGGVWNCMKGELRQMMVQGSGAIVNCSSIGGMVGSRGRSAYSASRHAVIA